MHPPTDNAFGLDPDALRRPGDRMRFPSKLQKHVDRARATLGDDARDLATLLPAPTGGRELLLPDGFRQIRKRLFKPEATDAGWTLRFDDIASLENASHVQEQFGDKTKLEYTNVAGERRVALLNGDWGQVPWMTPLLGDCIAPQPALLLKADARIRIEERRSSKARKYELIDTIKGQLVAFGPFLAEPDGPDSTMTVTWGPVFALVPRDLPGWWTTLEGWVAGSTGLLGAVADLGVVPPLINRAATFVISDMVGASRVSEVIDLPVHSGFLDPTDSSAEFGCEYDEAGRTHRWRWAFGTWRGRMHLFHNLWILRCARWWNAINQPEQSAP